jgi:hypothetical protein
MPKIVIKNKIENIIKINLLVKEKWHINGQMPKLEIK